MKRLRSSPLARLGVACAFAGFLCLIIVSGPEPAAPVPRTAEQTTPAADAAAGTADQRPIYRNSVVPGGVYSDSEAQAAVSSDPVVADHYRPVNLRKLTPVALDRPLQRYVSFRKSGRIYWTSRRMSVNRGELVLSDGESLVRARCGNRLSDRKEQPTLPSGTPEPTEDELASITGHTDSPVPSSSASPLTAQNRAPQGSYEGAGEPQPLIASPGSPSPETVVAAGEAEGGALLPYWTPGGLGGDSPRKPESVTDTSPLTPPPPPPQIPIFVGSLEPVPDLTVSIVVPPSVTAPEGSTGGATGPSGGGTPSGPSTPSTPPPGGGSEPSRPPDDDPVGPSTPTIPGGSTIVPTTPSGEQPSKPVPPQAIPEPGTLSLIGAALAALGICGARRSRSTGSGS